MLLAALAGVRHNSEICHPCFAVLVSHARRGEAEERKTQLIEPEAGTGGLLEAVPSQLPAARGHPFGHCGERMHKVTCQEICQEIFGMRGRSTACKAHIFCLISKSSSSELRGFGWRHKSPTTRSV